MLFNTFNADNMNIYLMGIFYSIYRDPVTSMYNNSEFHRIFHHFITNIKDLHDCGCHIENVIRDS